MSDLDFEQTVELEKNVKIKNQAIEICENFKKNITLSASSYEGDNRFKNWSDSHNSTYIIVERDHFVYECKFLHEYYKLKVTPEAVFGYIKNNTRGLNHLVALVKTKKEQPK